MEKMTKREFLVAIADMFEEVEDEQKMALRDFAVEEIKKMDETLAKRKAKASEKDKENAALRQKIYDDILKTDELMTATVVGEMMEISTQKASAQLRKLVNEGLAEKADVKVQKKGIQKGYRKIA